MRFAELRFLMRFAELHLKSFLVIQTRTVLDALRGTSFLDT